MRNIQTIIPALLIVLLVLSCGILDDLGIVVVVDDINTVMVPDTAFADIQSGSFAVANYPLTVNRSEISETNKLKKPWEEKRILITFSVDRSAGGSDAERGKYNAENIKWIHVYYYKDGGVKKKVLKNFEGSVLLPKFKMSEGEMPVAVDIRQGNDSLKGAFSAKLL